MVRLVQSFPRFLLVQLVLALVARGDHLPNLLENLLQILINRLVVHPQMVDLAFLVGLLVLLVLEIHLGHHHRMLPEVLVDLQFLVVRLVLDLLMVLVVRRFLPL